MDIMLWSTALVQWLHIVTAIIYGGGIIFAYYAVYPAVLKMPARQGQEFLGQMEKYSGKIFPLAGMLVVLLGIVRGTVFGPIRSWGVLFSPYGYTWILALVLAIVLSVLEARHEAIVGPLWEGDKVRASYVG